MTRKCPVCGSPHDTWGGVAVHLWKKQDGEHGHVKSKDDGLIWLAREGYMVSDTSTGDTSQDTPTDTTADADTLEVPAGDGGTATATTPDTDPSPECPQCDATTSDESVFSSDEYLAEARGEIPTETAKAIESHEYVCTSCWMAFP